MKKNKYILFFVLLAYSVILAHSFIPHTHSTFEPGKQTHHHHEAGDHHHHDDDEDQPPVDLFQFFYHTEVTGNSFIESKRIEATSKPRRVLNPTCLCKPLLVPDIGAPLLVYFNKEFDNFRPTKAVHFFFSLKAPPADLI